MSQQIELLSKNNRFIHAFTRFFSKSEKGATAVEYAILVGLISIALVAGGILLKGNIDTAMKTANCGVQGKTYSATSTNPDKCV